MSIWDLSEESALIFHLAALVRNEMSKGPQKWFGKSQKEKIKKKRKKEKGERISQKGAQIDGDSGRWMQVSQSSDRPAWRSKQAIKILSIHKALKFVLLFLVRKILMRTETGPVLIHFHDDYLTKDRQITSTGYILSSFLNL